MNKFGFIYDLYINLRNALSTVKGEVEKYPLAYQKTQKKLVDTVHK